MNQSSLPTTRALVLAVREEAADGTDACPARGRVLGLPVLARTLYALQKGGIGEAYVVTDHARAEMEAAVRKVKQITIQIHWLDVDGHANCPLLAGESVLQDPFILTQSGVLFDPSSIADLRHHTDGLLAVDILVDRSVDGRPPVAAQPKVRVTSDRATDWGVRLARYDAVDTGVYLASPRLFRVAREIGDSGRRPLSRVIEKSVELNDVRVTDVEGRMWQRFDSPADVKAMERTLLVSVRKPTDGPISKYLNRPVSIAMSRVLVKTAVTPNQITTVGLILGLASGVFAAFGGYLGFLAGGVLFQFTSILDGTDGEVAKLTLRSSRHGEWFDTIADGITELAYLVGLLVGVYRTQSDFLFYSGLLALAVAVLTLGNLYVYLMLRKHSGSLVAVTYWYQESTGLLSRVFRVLHYLGKRDMIAFVVFVLAVIGQAPLIFPIFGFPGAVLLVPTAVSANLILLWRMWRSRRARMRAAATVSLEP